MEKPTGASYTMTEVIDLTGLTAQRLHTWERRYAVVQPERKASGARIYTEAAVKHLHLLKQCVDAGHRIGKLAVMTMDQLVQVTERPSDRQPLCLNDLVDATQRMDASFLEDRLALHFAALGPVRFSCDVVFPLLRTVGDLWETNQVSVAGEHLLSGTIRTLLGQALRLTARRNEDPIAIFAAPWDELHELGALCAAVCAQSAGLRVLYLGARLPANQIGPACTKLGATIVGLSITCAPLEKVIPDIAAIASQLPQGVELWLGGAAVKNLGPAQIPQARVLHTIAELDQAIKQFRAREATSA
jgi:MerR family transcriptional regulator, light-induced transcriptional regulator